MRSFGVRKQVAEIILKEHREKHCERAGQCEEVSAVEPAEALSTDVIVAALEEGGCAKKLPRPEPRRKATVSRRLQVIGYSENDERKRGTNDDAALVWRTRAKPEWKHDGDDKPSGALEVVERLVSGEQSSADESER